jgi:hypothetical protein
MDQLLDLHCDREIAEILNGRGRQTWEGKPFNLKKIAFIRTAYEPAQPPRKTSPMWAAHDPRTLEILGSVAARRDGATKRAC